MLHREHNERRAKARFPMDRELRYKLLEDDRIVESGMGQTLNVGSGGVAFVVDRELRAGAFVELSISWPVLLDETCKMRLIVYGRLLRSAGRKSVCTVDKYEFRTQARVLAPAAPVRADSTLLRWAEGMRRESVKALNGCAT